MRILFLCSEIPYPINNGVRIPVFNFIKTLSVYHVIDLICFESNDKREDEACGKEMKKYCDYIEILKKPTVNKYKKILKIIFYSNPYYIYNLLSVTSFEKIKDYIKKYDPDVIHYDTILMSGYKGVNINNAATVISPNDSYSLAIESEIKIKMQYSRISKFYKKILLKKTKRYESLNYSMYDFCHVVSRIDAEYLKRLNPNINIRIISNGVDTDYFNQGKIYPKNKTAIFVGAIVGGNYYYIKDFINNIWLHVCKLHEDAKLYIVGKVSDRIIDELLALSSRIEFLGYINNIQNAYSNSLTVVNPINKNCGIVNKALEGMSMGRVVVGYTVGFSGIPECENGINVMMGETNYDLINIFDRLFNDYKLAVKIGNNARRLVEDRYSWNSRNDIINSLYVDAYKKKIK